MPPLPGNRTYRRLFAAQVIALVGTGLATVALSLLAYDIAESDAGTVLGTALAIKVAAYVAVAPLIGAVAARVPPRVLLAGADAVRAGIAAVLPFVTHVWQVYVLILLLQAASAAFTPTFQATLPQVLREEPEYTRALTLSRLAYDLESLFSPALAAGLLAVVSYDWLFAGTVAGFAASAALVVSAVLPKPAPTRSAGRTDRDPCKHRARALGAKATSGTRLLWTTPCLRALLALDLAVAAAGAIVFVDTVVVVRDHFGRSAGAVSLALGAYGAGSMAAALLLPHLLERLGDRRVMLSAAYALPVPLAVAAAVTAVSGGTGTWLALLGAWAAIGAASSAVLTPSGRLIRRSASDAELPEAYAAQFSLSHACWLVTYPLAGWLGAGAGLPATAGVLAALVVVGAVAATAVWPASHEIAASEPENAAQNAIENAAENDCANSAAAQSATCAAGAANTSGAPPEKTNGKEESSLLATLNL
ncbi:MFS transporter [Yinghuangia sp. YIM S09857]|uniref:MFS transporter n=1 Tax=Yinghuangia sp. YIM S09857 TaxID=3436929 RepID=UPI003F536E4C